MIGLLDTNVMIALFDEAHLHHAIAHEWMNQHIDEGWATCPLTQNGCVRVMSQPQYPGRLPVAEVCRRLIAATAQPTHVFWPDSVSICSSGLFLHDRILTPKLLTDVYLLALAVSKGGRLVTFDRTIPERAVVGASRRHMVVL